MKIEGVIKQFEQAGWNGLFGKWYNRGTHQRKSFFRFSHTLSVNHIWVEIQAQAVIESGKLVVTYMGNLNQDDVGSARIYAERFNYVLTPEQVIDRVYLAINAIAVAVLESKERVNEY